MDTPEKQPERSYTRRYLTIILLFGVCVVGVFFLFRTYPYPGGLSAEVYLWMYLALVLALTIAMVNVVLKDLLHRRRLHGILSAIAERGLIRGIASHIPARTKKERGPFFVFGSLGAVICLVVLLLARYDVLFDPNLKLLQHADANHSLPPDGDGPVRILQTFTSGRGTEARLRWFLRATEDLKKAGAKVVVVELPSWISRARVLDVVEKIRATGVAVFGVEAGYAEVNWGTSHYQGGLPKDGAYRDAGVLSAAPLSLEGRLTWEAPLGCYVPYGFSHDSFNPIARTTERDTTSDVVLEVLRKFHGYPATLRPRINGNAVVFGDYRIPVTPAGLAVIRRPPSTILPVYGGDDWLTDSTGYRAHYSGDTTMAADLSAFTTDIRGKIVILSHRDEGDVYRSNYWLRATSTAWALNSSLRHDFITVRNDLDVWLILAASVLSVLIVLRMKPLLAFICMLVLGILLAAGAAWLYLGAATMIEVAYPLLVLALGMAVLPVARLIREIRLDAGT